MVCVHSRDQQHTLFNSNFYKYGTVDLSTGAFTSLDFFPPGSNYQPVTGDNLGTDEQYAIMANNAFTTFYLWNINFNTLSGDSIGVVGPLAAGQTAVKGNGTQFTYRYLVCSKFK